MSMKKEIIAQIMEMPLYYWTTIISLCITFVFFIGVIIWLYIPSRKCNYDSYAELPLKDHEKEHKNR